MLASLFLHFQLDYQKARLMRSSDVRSIFQSKAYGEWRKSREAEQKVQLAVVERLDVVIKAIGQLGKVLSRLPQ